MRIAWFTPFSERSAIGEFSRHVTAALAEHAEVEIWTADAAPHHPSSLPVTRFSATDELGPALELADAVVYSIGNFLAYHHEIHQVSQRHPGIVIVHDRVLHHLFVQSWTGPSEEVDAAYVARMAEYYGERGARVARESAEGRRRPVWELDAEVVEYPLDEEALRRALGAVTHARGHAERIAGRWFGPVHALAFPTYRELLVRGAQSAAPPPPRRDGRLQLTTIGHVIANKNVTGFLELLAADAALAARVHYSVVGPLDAGGPYTARLEELLRRNPQLSAELCGWCEEDELDRRCGATDIFVNLRWPSTEGGSASLARQLAFGRPIVCFDDGSFGELPGDVVARVPAGDFAGAAAQVRRLLADPERRRQLGERARAFAGTRDEREYARGLIAFIEEVRARAPAMRLLNRVADELAAMRADPGLPLFTAIAEDFGRLLAPLPER